MLKFALKLLLSVVAGMASYFIVVLLFYIDLFEISEILPPYASIIAGIVCGALFLTFFSSFFTKIILKQLKKTEDKLVKMSLKDLIAGLIGAVTGLVIANIIGIAVNRYGLIGTAIISILNVLLGYLGYRVAMLKKEEFHFLSEKKPVISGRPKILDTSVIIDGRIIDILKTGFIEGTIVIPSFVLDELRHIADSSDGLRRNRGRRGLDVLNDIQKKITKVNVEIVEWDSEDKEDVDIRLLKMAQKMDAFIVTNDFNLNKVADFQGVSVLNINELSNAIKPVVLPGEEIYVDVIKDGKELGQGIGYLNDGTMIVIEGGNKFIGETADVLVTSVLQTAAGRMIFTKTKDI